MDRLEKALEKSRQQRSALDPSLVKSSYTGTTNGGVAGGMAAPSYGTPHALPVAANTQDIDEDHMERNRIVAHHIRSPRADIYRQLRTQVLQIMNKSGFRTLAITSANYGDGKTTVALNLGISIALDLKQTVLMVDLDLRKPNMHEYLGAPTGPGLTDYLHGEATINECMTRPPFDRMTVLPAGGVLDNSSEVLGSPRMIALARELKTRYPDRLVIYDMPPVLTQDDSIAFLPQVDAVLVVVRDGVTKTEDLKRCLTRLSGANVIGTVLNNCW